MGTPPQAPPYITAATGDFGPGYGAPAGAMDPHAAYGAPVGGAAPARGRSGSDARPTLMIRTDKRSRRAIIIATGAGALAAVALVLALISGSNTAAPGAQPASSAPVAAPPESAKPDEATGPSATGRPAAAPAEPAAVAAPPVAAPPAAVRPPPAAHPAAATGGTDRTAAAPAASNRPSPPASPPAAAPEPAKPGEAAGALLSTAPGAATDASKKRLDPLHKPARPKSRPEVKRADPKRAKNDSKEPSWNDDSPFMPVPMPPKR
jgi:hypothetical protein